MSLSLCALAVMWSTHAEAGSVRALSRVDDGPQKPDVAPSTPTAPQNTAPKLNPVAKALFVANCAPCHGENGDGKGTTVLERPARSFKDGGFSYGNTPETLLRTITNGIPGTQMPSFGSALKDDQRKLLASYVIALGPEQIAVETKDTLMVVHDKPLIVRGNLPPIVDGAPERPRGLLIGTPDGLTFEYRTDDVRLLGVRSGEFVDRKDWVGRGGDPLQPLGKLVVPLVGSGDTPVFSNSLPEIGRVNFVARLVSTWVKGAEAGVTYDVLSPDQRVRSGPALRVDESPRGFTCALGAGYARRFEIEALQDVVNFEFDYDPRPRDPIAHTMTTSADGGTKQTLFATYRAIGESSYDLMVARVSALDSGVGGGAHVCLLTMKKGDRRVIEVRHLPRVTLSTDKPLGAPTGWQVVFQ